MQDVWRLFAAIEIPPEVRDRVAAVRDRLRDAGWRAKWVNPEGTHLTLKFYGNVPVDDIPALREALRPAVATSRPFTIEAAGAGAFPNPRRPTGAVARCCRRCPSAGRAAAVRRAGQRGAGVSPRRSARFHPHLTLARVRPEDLGSLRDVERRLAEIGALPPLPIPVDRVTLFRSELRRTGAVYTVVDEFPLGGAG